MILTVSPVTSAADMQIQIDGVTLVSEVKPEIKNSRMMVPLRVISENLWATVNWSGSDVILKKRDLEVVITLNSNKAAVNGKPVLLDAKPYLKDNRTFVPLRFIAQAFDCNVMYTNAIATIKTKPFYIDGVKITAVHEEFQMTMGSIMAEIKGNAYIEEMYNILKQNKGAEVEAPGNLSPNYRFAEGYDRTIQVYFVSEKGDYVERFSFYSSILSIGESEDKRRILMYADTENKWYTFTSKAYHEILKLNSITSMYGFQTTISNSTP
ncbi:copper amine oxidase N-terminal domain-containing protein [Paenibacillus xanthanilyticus]